MKTKGIETGTCFEAKVKSGSQRTESFRTKPETTGSPITLCPVISGKSYIRSDTSIQDKMTLSLLDYRKIIVANLIFGL